MNTAAEGEPPTKMAKTGKRIGTHSGTFHADEALACYMLLKLPEYADADIIRTRDPAVLDTMDILVDVGAEFDPERNRFDHHQRGFEETFGQGYKIKLSSAGLIYKYFGKQVLQVLTGCTEEKTINVLYQKVYKTLIEAMDGIDNGVLQYSGDQQPAYSDSTHLAARVGRLNPAWNEKNVDVDKQFQKAMALAGQELEDIVHYLYNSWLAAREIVQKALSGRQDVHASGRIIELDTGCPWKDHLFDLESEQNIEAGNLVYCIYPDESGTWRVQGIPTRENSFICRKFLPEAWQGLRGEELSKACGIPNCVFVHANGFIGGHQTKEGALEMAVKALEA